MSVFSDSIDYIQELNNIEIPYPPGEIKKETIPAIIFAIDRLIGDLNFLKDKVIQL